MKQGINIFTLKLIAMVAMLIDHIGWVFFPQSLIFPMIGRLAYPIFAFALVEGFCHTSNVKKYLLRLSVLAVLSEIPFDLVFFNKVINWEYQNVFFTLFLGIVLLYLLERFPSVVARFVSIVALLTISELLHTDYSSKGLLMILAFYLFRNRIILQSFFITLINLLLGSELQWYALFSLPLIALYNGKRGPNMKWLFYAFYPVHLIILYLIYLIL